MRRLLTILAAVLLAIGIAAAPATADSGGADNTAVAINTKDGSSLFRLAFSIRHVMGDVVDTSNAAVAFSSCTDCQTVAIAIEIVLIESDASTITPTNIAFAYNYECTLCVSVAEAYQFLLTTGGNVHFTAEGNQTLAQIRQELEALRNENLTIDELQAKLNAIAQEIANVLATQLVPAGNSSGTQPSQSQPNSTQPASTEPTSTATTPTTTSEPTTTSTTPTDTTSTTTPTTTSP
jgi:putative peptide zinc metalloprotease protein